MKKTLITILFLFCAISVFAETGYKKLEWYTPTAQVIDKLKYETQSDLPIDEEVEDYVSIFVKQPIYGDLVNVIYDVTNGGLQSVSYIVPTKKAKEITKNYTKKVKEYKANSMSQKKRMAELEEEEGIKYTDTRFYITYCHVVGDMSLFAEIEGYNIFDELSKGTESNNKGRIIIYDYNDDTRVYIYENIIEGQTVVVYVPHEQDY